MKVSEALADALAIEAAGPIFGLMGDANMPVWGALCKDSGTRMVWSRDDDAAILMADGYSKATGKLGVVTVTCGPGLANGEHVEVLAPGLPAPVDALPHDVDRDAFDADQVLHDAFAHLGAHRRDADAAVAEHDRRHAVQRRACRQRVPGKLRVVVGVRVDEARREDPAFGVDAAPRRRAAAPPRRRGDPWRRCDRLRPPASPARWLRRCRRTAARCRR